MHLLRLCPWTIIREKIGRADPGEQTAVPLPCSRRELALAVLNWTDNIFVKLRQGLFLCHILLLVRFCTLSAFEFGKLLTLSKHVDRGSLD